MTTPIREPRIGIKKSKKKHQQEMRLRTGYNSTEFSNHFSNKKKSRLSNISYYCKKVSQAEKQSERYAEDRNDQYKGNEDV